MYFSFNHTLFSIALSHNSERTTTHRIALTNAWTVFSSELFDAPVLTATSDSAVLKKAEKNTSETKFLAASLFLRMDGMNNTVNQYMEIHGYNLNCYHTYHGILDYA